MISVNSRKKSTSSDMISSMRMRISVRKSSSNNEEEVTVIDGTFIPPIL